MTVALCGAIGFEREVRDQPAGFRTHILLGLEATLFTLVSAYGFEPFTRAALDRGGLQFDPTRIAAQIVTGVGFLWTAASLWATAAIGTAVGAGYLFGAAATTALAMATLYALRSFRSSVIYPLRIDTAGLDIVLKEPGSSPQDAFEVLQHHDIAVRTIEAEIDEERARYKLQVRVPPPHGVNRVLADLAAPPEVERVHLAGLRYSE